MSSFSFPSPNSHETQSRSHGGSHITHVTLTNAVEEEEWPDTWSSWEPRESGVCEEHAGMCICKELRGRMSCGEVVSFACEDMQTVLSGICLHGLCWMHMSCLLPVP